MKKNKIKLSLYDAIIECVAIQQKTTNNRE